MREVRRVRASIDQSTDPDGDRYYIWEGKNYWSVTTILSALPKYWMGPWSRKVTATHAVENIETLNTMIREGGAADAISWLKAAANNKRDRAAYIGKIVHEAAEAYALGRPYPEWTDSQRPFMENAFLPWLEKWKPEFVAIEAPVFSEQHRYAGTLDAIVDVGGSRFLIDYKTGATGVYPEVGLQLASYRFSETFVGLPDGDEEPTPEVDGAAVVWLRPDGFQFIPIRADRQVFDSFLYVREVFRWVKDIQRSIVGKKANVNHQVCVREGCGHHVLSHGPLHCYVPDCACVSFRATPLKKEVLT